jgi:hypothetical protein
MKSKAVFIIFLLLLISGVCFWYLSLPTSFLIKAGRYPLTVQFISDTSGIVNITTNNDSLLINGSSYNSDSSRFIQLSGYIENNVNDSFTFVGKIYMYVSEGCCGLINKSGSWTFRRMENRTFFRLKERDDLCSCYTCCIYLDINLTK